MRYLSMFFLSIIVVLLTGCNDKTISPVESSGEQTTQQDLSLRQLKSTSNFQAHLNGDSEVPPVDTRAQGQAIFRLSSDGNSIYYKVIAANINNVLMAHIHLAPAGSIGDVVVWLYPDAPPPQLIPDRFNGVLAEGTITDSDLVGDLAGMSIADLLAEIINGNTYVNVHTTQNPGGEIRGQIK